MNPESANKLTHSIYLETPENVRLAFRLAGPGSRLGAYLVDVVLRTFVLWALSMGITLLLMPFNEEGLSQGVFLVILFAVEWGYFCAFEAWWNGQTPGKRIFGLRVISVEGYAIGFYEAMLRNLLRVADFVPIGYTAGLVVSASNQRMQRIGDLVAGTMVIREKQSPLRGALTQIESLEPIPASHFAAGFRPSEKTLDMIERLYRRNEELAPARIDEIAEVLATPLSTNLNVAETKIVARHHPGEFLFRTLRTFRNWEPTRSETPTESLAAVS